MSWFSLGGFCRSVVQAPSIFLESFLGFFPLASSVCCWLGVVRVDPWLSTLCGLAVEVVTLVLCQVLVGLPSWSCSASGFLGPVVFLVFTLGHLSQVRSVFFLNISFFSLWVYLFLCCASTASFLCLSSLLSFHSSSTLLGLFFFSFFAVCSSLLCLLSTLCCPFLRCSGSSCASSRFPVSLLACSVLLLHSMGIVFIAFCVFRIGVFFLPVGLL